jgi:DNA-binding transcriptional ArsR family regulator
MAMSLVGEDLAVAACLFHGFGDASRLAIVRHLALGEHRVVELTEHLGLAQSTVSKHLACLRDCGLVESRPQGRASMFSLSHPEATMDLLAAAERMLGLTGDAVALCPNYGLTSTSTSTSANTIAIAEPEPEPEPELELEPSHG